MAYVGGLQWHTVGMMLSKHCQFITSVNHHKHCALNVAKETSGASPSNCGWSATCERTRKKVFFCFCFCFFFSLFSLFFSVSCFCRRMAAIRGFLCFFRLFFLSLFFDLLHFMPAWQEKKSPSTRSTTAKRGFAAASSFNPARCPGKKVRWWAQQPGTSRSFSAPPTASGDYACRDTYLHMFLHMYVHIFCCAPAYVEICLNMCRLATWYKCFCANIYV